MLPFVSSCLHSGTTDSVLPLKDGPPLQGSRIFGLQYKTNRSKGQIFVVSTVLPSGGSVPSRGHYVRFLPVISFTAFFFKLSYGFQPKYFNGRRVLHICIYWLTWGSEVIYFGMWILYLSSSSLFQSPFPGTGKLFSITCSFFVVLKPKLFHSVRWASRKWLVHII